MNIGEVLRSHKLWLNGDSGGVKADLRRADLRRADLCGANLRDANLRGADLDGADLREAYLREANLRGADLRKANLHGADLREANLREANLRGADLRGTDLRETGIVVFQCGVHTAYIGHGAATVGCQTYPIEKWIDCGADIAQSNGFEDEWKECSGVFLAVLREMMEGRS